MTRKIISLLLCAAFAAGSLSLLASCAGEKNDNKGSDEVKESPSAKVPLSLNFSSLDEESRTIRIAYSEGANDTITEHSLVLDDTNMDTSDTVDLAVVERNRTIESQLGVILVADRVVDDFGGLADEIKDNIIAGNGDYDIVAGYQYYTIGMATSDNGLMLNLADLDNVGLDGINADYIDINAPYWANAYNNAISYKGAYYWLTGDLALRFLGGMYCTFINTKTYDEKIKDTQSAILGTTYGSIYDLAREGKWTLDLMAEMAALCYVDNPTEGTIDVADEFDTYGFGFELQDPIDGIAFGSDIQFSFKDPETGDVTLTFANDKTVAFANKLTSLMKAKSSYNYAATDSQTVMTNFASGKVAITVNKIFMAQKYLMEMQDGFYLVPAPKYDTTQGYYVTGIHDGVTIYGIPKDCMKLEQTAATLELMAAYSTMLVKTPYYDTALKNRYARGGEAAEMIDLIHNSVNTDFAAAWSQSIENIVHSFRTLTPISYTTFGRQMEVWDTKLEELITGLEAAADNSKL